MIYNRTNFLLCLFCFLSIHSFAQTSNDNMIYQYVEEMPEFKGDINTYIAKNVVYPYDAIKEEVEGRVTVKFIVYTLGKVFDVSIVRSVYPSIDSEALRVVRNMPAWKPAKQNGKPVMVFYTLPILFKLTDPDPKK